MLDSMCRQISAKSGCRRWPLAVFFNILDLAGVNAWILFKEKTHSRISRRNFLHQLSAELRKDVDDEASPTRPDPAVVLESRVTYQIHVNCQNNRTVNLCRQCARPVCGKCQAAMCVSSFHNLENE